MLINTRFRPSTNTLENYKLNSALWHKMCSYFHFPDVPWLTV